MSRAKANEELDILWFKAMSRSIAENFTRYRSAILVAAECNKPWINLTDEEIDELDDEISVSTADRTDVGWWDAYDTLGFARLIEQKLKEKNNG